MIENIVNNLSLYLQGSVFLAFLAAYLGGVIISFTPCTYPLIPVTVGFIGARGASSKLRGFFARGASSKLRGFFLSLFYVGGLSFTYSILGGVAALSGRLFGQMQTTSWTYLIMGNLCLIMGLSMLDVFSFSLPVPQKLMKISGNINKKGFGSSFLMGTVSGVVIGPCTTPVLAVLLGYVAVKTNILLGMTLLFVFAFGMGTLLIIVGTFAGVIAALPKSGEWMTKIKFVFGLILIGAAEYFLYTAGVLSI
ncbi:MAG: sulfite exporter TauE/SafE family protein [Deltaproteobacteria bacterium]|nr:sulfite exporter TauE/SafE family protein [Deltaproteobacteria bacterium]